MELADPKGEHDGEVYSAYLGKKVSYFKCKPNHGIYVKSDELKVEYIGNGNNSDSSNYKDNDQKSTDVKKMLYIIISKHLNLKRILLIFRKVRMQKSTD